MIDTALAGVLNLSCAAGGTIVLTANNGAADQARYPLINCTGALPNNTTIQCPGVTKTYDVINSTTGAFTLRFKTAGGVAVAVTQGQSARIYCDGTDFHAAITAATLGALGSVGAQTITVSAAVAPLTLTGTDPGATNFGLVVYHNSASPAVNDIVTVNQFFGNNSGIAQAQYFQDQVSIDAVTAGIQSGHRDFFSFQGGSPVLQLGIGNGVVIGAPAGSYKGANTINASAYYAGGVAGYLLGTRQSFTGSGTWTRPASCRAVLVRVWGAGGGGGGAAATAAGQVSNGAGGSSGGYGEKWIVGPGATETITIGAAGAGGAAGANAGGAGGSSSFGSTVGALGGSGGGGGIATATSFSNAAIGAVGAGSLGDLNINGVPGSPGASSNGGNGGAAPVAGGGGIGGAFAAGGASGFGGGGGAGGNGSAQATPRAGGAGGAGRIEVFEYY